MAIYKQKPTKPLANGYCVGIIDGPWKIPYIPGDVTNASSYDYPVVYNTCTDLDVYKIAEGDPSVTEHVVETVRGMAQLGVKGISGDCGFMINYLPKAARAVDVPVFLSSLQILPLVASMIGNDRAIAIVTPFPDKMTPDLMAKSGFKGERRVVPLGLQDCEEFMCHLATESDQLDADKVHAEMAALATKAVKDNPDLGAFLLECSMLPPYSKTVREATGLPVFDFITMIDLFQRATHRKRYKGYY